MQGRGTLILQSIPGRSSNIMSMSPEHLEPFMPLSTLMQSIEISDVTETADDDVELCLIVEQRREEPSRDVSLDEL
ncbi:hypothetical protein DK254_26560 [Pseudomonas sp. RW407]|nr:hypothetical protein DK254_26560 [Pseudomonas sp. RW407]